MNPHLQYLSPPVPRWLRLAIVALAFFNLLALVARSRHVDIRYWSDGLALAIALIVASALLLTRRLWSQLLAAMFTLPMVLWFCYVALKVHGLLHSTLAEKTFLRDADSWRQFLWNHPAVFLQYVIAAIVLLCALIYLFRSVTRKRLTLQPGG